MGCQHGVRQLPAEQRVLRGCWGCWRVLLAGEGREWTPKAPAAPPALGHPPQLSAGVLAPQNWRAPAARFHLAGAPPGKLRGATSTTGAAPPPWPAPTLGCGLGMGGGVTHPWSPPRQAWGTRRVQVPGGNAAAARPRWRRKHLRHPPVPGAGVAAGPPTPGVTPTQCHRAPVAPYPAAPVPRHRGVPRGAVWVRGQRHRGGPPVSTQIGEQCRGAPTGGHGRGCPDRAPPR